MAVEDGAWIMKGVEWEDRTSSVDSEGTARHGCRAPRNDMTIPECIHTIEELEKYIGEVGFLPLFANGVEGRGSASGAPVRADRSEAETFRRGVDGSVLLVVR